MRLLLMMFICSAASAGEKPLAVVVPPEISGVIYKVDDLRQILIAHVSERLRGRGYTVVGSNTLTPEDSACHAQACLEGIPARYNLDLVIAPRLESDEQSHNYRISVRLFGNGFGYKTRERLCVGCSDFNARDMLGDTVVEMLGGTVVDVPAPTPAPIVHSQPRADRTRWIYRGVGIGLLAVGALGLAQGFAEVAHDGDRGCDAGGCYHLDTTKGQATFLTLGLAAVVGGAVLSYFGWRPEKKLTVSGIQF